MKKILFGLVAMVFGFISGFVIANAYEIMYAGGFSPIPAYVYGYSGFSNDTVTAIHNACTAWNGAGVGNLVYRSTSTHNIITYPYQNNRNDITKVNVGADRYLMQAYPTQYGFVNNKMSQIETDININVYNDFGKVLTSSDTYYDTQSIMTHEIGHLLGLAECFRHEEERCMMFHDFDKGEIRRALKSDDILGISEIY